MHTSRCDPCKVYKAVIPKTLLRTNKVDSLLCTTTIANDSSITEKGADRVYVRTVKVWRNDRNKETVSCVAVGGRPVRRDFRSSAISLNPALGKNLIFAAGAMHLTRSRRRGQRNLKLSRFIEHSLRSGKFRRMTDTHLRSNTPTFLILEYYPSIP